MLWSCVSIESAMPAKKASIFREPLDTWNGVFRGCRQCYQQTTCYKTLRGTGNKTAESCTTAKTIRRPNRRTSIGVPLHNVWHCNWVSLTIQPFLYIFVSVDNLGKFLLCLILIICYSDGPGNDLMLFLFCTKNWLLKKVVTNLYEIHSPQCLIHNGNFTVKWVYIFHHISLLSLLLLLQLPQISGLIQYDLFFLLSIFKSLTSLLSF